MVAALALDGSFLSESGKGSIENALLFYTTSNPLQKLAFDAFRNKDSVMVVVVPIQKNDGHLTIMELGGKPLAFFTAHDEIIIFDDEDEAFFDERAMWLEQRHFDRFVRETALSLPATPAKYGLRLAGYLTKEDRDKWQRTH